VRVLQEINPDELRAAAAGRELTWLELIDPSDEQVAAAGQALHLHKLAIEDSQEFGQRPKLDRYDDKVLLVFFGLRIASDDEPRMVEVHIHISGQVVLTVTRTVLPQLERVREQVRGDDVACSEGELLYRMLDAIVDSLTDGLEQIARRLDAFERTIFTRPRASDRDQMAILRRQLAGLRRTLLTQHQVFAHVLARVMAASTETDDARSYMSDVADHLESALDDTAAGGDALESMLQTYSNEVQERLTVVATIFLPLTVLTGFFGMNFNWMINHLGSAAAFFGLGIGAMVVSIVLIIVILRQTGLIDRPNART
jgi:magnesium transporter